MLAHFSADFDDGHIITTTQNLFYFFFYNLPATNRAFGEGKHTIFSLFDYT